MIVISTECHTLIGEVSLPWNTEVEVSDEEGLYYITLPGVIAKKDTQTELLSEPEISSKATKFSNKD
jgi:hypothetical protein